MAMHQWTRKKQWALLVMCALGSAAQNPNTVGSSVRLDGRAWLSAVPDEREGLVEGLSDCLTWDAGTEGFNGTAQQMVVLLTEFYRSHPQEQSRNVKDVWQQLWSSARRPHSGGQDWKKPHWYLDGFGGWVRAPTKRGDTLRVIFGVCGMT